MVCWLRLPVPHSAASALCWPSSPHWNASPGGHQHGCLSFPGALIPSCLNPLQTESPAFHRCQGPAIGLSCSLSRHRRRTSAEAGTPGGRPSTGEAGPQQEPTSDGRPQPWEMRALSQGDSHYAATVPPGPGRHPPGRCQCGAGPGPPQSRGEQAAFRRSPARRAADRGACTLDPGSHFSKCWLQSLPSPPPHLPGWTERSPPPAARCSAFLESPVVQPA